MWDYTGFAKSLTKDPSRIWTATVNSEDELEKVLASLPKDKLVFIEVHMDKMDYPAVMNRVFREKPKVSLYQG